MQNMKVSYILKTLQSWCSDSLEPFYVTLLLLGMEHLSMRRKVSVIEPQTASQMYMPPLCTLALALYQKDMLFTLHLRSMVKRGKADYKN